MTITRVKLERFTAFDNLDVEFSPGVNAFVGVNGTGKTHLLKVCYAACDITKTGADFVEKLVNIFLPSSRFPGKLVNRGNTGGTVKIFRGDVELEISIGAEGSYALEGLSDGAPDWTNTKIESAYIPAKEALANAPGFLSLYAAREIHFEEVYADILHRAYLPPLRSPVDSSRQRLLDSLEDAIGGKITIQNGEFFLSSKQGILEFTLLAEGMRKLGLLWLLIRNGSLREGAVLFWDEPETNLNPKLYGVVMDALLELQRLGVQIFLATHDYVILKELDLRQEKDDRIAFHSLYRAETGEIVCNTTDKYLHVRPNAIADAFTSIYDRGVKRSLEGLWKCRSS